MRKAREPVSEIAERIERVCTLLGDGELEACADQAGAGEILTRILAALGDSEYDDPALVRDLDALDGAMAECGFGAVTQPERVYQPLDGSGAGHPVVQAWVCPAHRRCSRVEPVAGTRQPPMCAATRHQLALVRVAS
ncbi:hypothetical protein FLW53_36400 [Microbispora sp. SCL1-1]|uniref:hypothetical protein n=1 Tax=unclassified Microbispora TaxID=2614687 RepID=UPI00115B4134|nr:MULTISPECIES: hypothetical protein [unclassified Microbispora]NJP29586.1 hypothetical protein [Microbispora sp. CL1-1]TQS04751.1 hypothetical protein FLW53_36400 [Microbispora sp. SCL1-1]